MKFDFNCSKCGTKFSIESTYMENKEKVICPSCDMQLSEVILNDLKAITASVENFKKDSTDEVQKNHVNNQGIIVQIAL